MMSINKYWFYLEPTTFIFQDSEHFLLYNSESAHKILLNRTRELNQFIEKLQDINNLYGVEITDSYDIWDVKECIRLIREKYMGDIIASKTSPICIPPVFKCHADKPSENIYHSKGTSVMSLLNSVTFFLNGECLHNCPQCSQYYKQFICCHKTKHELHIKDVISQIEHCISTSSVSLNFCGGNIFLYKEIRLLLNYLQANNLKSNLYFNYLNWEQSWGNYFANDLFNLHVYANYPVNEQKLSSFIFQTKQIKHKIHFYFIVSSEDEYLQTSVIISENDITWSSIIPFYDGKNKSFFEQNIYTNEEDLAEASPDKNEIFKRQVINIHDFGKLIVTSSGNIYANINHPPIGSIHEDLPLAINKELQEGTSWKRIRNQEPCNDCIYQYICPSPSNYELITSKNNLCNIR